MNKAHCDSEEEKCPLKASKMQPGELGKYKINRICQSEGKLAGCQPKCIEHSEPSPRSCPSPPQLLPRPKADSEGSQHGRDSLGMEISLLPPPRLAPKRSRDPVMAPQTTFSAIQVHFYVRPLSLGSALRMKGSQSGSAQSTSVVPLAP